MGPVAESVTYLTADTCLTATPGVARSIKLQSYTFVETDHIGVSMAIQLHSVDSRSVVVSYKRKYVHEVLVNRLVKLGPVKTCGKVT